MKQYSAEIRQTLDVSPEAAWSVIGAVGGVDKWFNGLIKSCRVENGQRFCETADGLPLEEDILEVNHEEKVFRYGIPTQEMLPIQNILASMKIEEGAAGKSDITWSGTFDAEPADAEQAKEAIQGLWVMGLNSLEAYIQNQPQAA
ncbi:SRPBCC family protein [Pontibacter sp. G13]|uniref:SRPBCC family protein n=1 Tax=Pontibacter sp. G13 TaxID=3074898 RepID=UPI0028894ADD|nr:SRPBCC family protein [Pontibacter sp. G13]WNJ20343.1 SRPBCC family protein [Pontibacter sp. G13]